ncbi:hypothetical protein G6F65_021393 [Rhizopus arrhizus]|nr:hypothetical protein G6F65_021393 [Rhizopus arrhizus]
MGNNCLNSSCQLMRDLPCECNLSLGKRRRPHRIHAFLAYIQYGNGMRLTQLFKAAGVAAALTIAGAAHAGTVDTIKKRGELVCGVSQGSAGLSIADKQGRWTGLDADLCRALAAAVLAALSGAAVGRDRRAEPQHDHHVQPRRGPGHRVRRHRLL